MNRRSAVGCGGEAGRRGKFSLIRWAWQEG